MNKTFYTYDYLEKNGRLGNQLWQIAATIGEADRNNGIARFRPDWEYRPYFSLPDYFFEPVPDGAEVVDGGTNYFQEYHYFQNVGSEIKDWFAPSDEAYDILDQRILELNMDRRMTCAVHVRRGDYLNHPNLFPFPTARYYREAVNSVVKEWHDTLFLVFSDDPEWCRANLAYLGVEDEETVVIDGVTRPVEVADRVGEPMDWIDMFLISECKKHVISNSTFAWWGAWLSNNQSPIYPSKWFGKGVPNWERWENAMPNGWRKFRV